MFALRNLVEPFLYLSRLIGGVHSRSGKRMRQGWAACSVHSLGTGEIFKTRGSWWFAGGSLPMLCGVVPYPEEKGEDWPRLRIRSLFR